jgi:fructokinase
VLVVGESLVDVISTDGREWSYVGGSPLNVAVGLARLGVPTTLACQLGSDERGQQIVQHLDDSGVRLEALRPAPRRTSTAVATPTGDRVDYEFDVTWDPEVLPTVADFTAVHVGSLGAVVEPGATRVADLAAAAHARGVAVCFDPNVRLTVEPEPSVWRRAAEKILPFASVVKMSDEDAAILAPGISPPDLAAALARDGKVVVITCGDRGAYAASPVAHCHTAARASHVADTIGAGDAFMSAAIAWLVRQGWPDPADLGSVDLAALGDFASAAAGIACTRPGANPPWSGELCHA